MQRYLFKLGLPLATGLFLFTGCVDENYDLSDIDTTTELRVNDLTIPIRIKPLELENVLNINEDDPDAMIIVDRSDPENPMFVVRKKGDFSADASSVEKITAQATEIESTSTQASGDIVNYTLHSSPGMRAAAALPAVKFEVGSQTTTFNYDIKDTDKALYTISQLGLENTPSHKTKIRIRVGSTDIANFGERVIFENIKLQFSENTEIEVPEGASFSNGILTIPMLEANTSDGHTPYYDIVVKGFNFAKPIRLKNDNQTNERGSGVISEMVGINSADLYVIPRAGSDITRVPTDISVMTDYFITDMVVNEFSGQIRYEVDINGIPDIELTDVPTFLAGDETDIRLYEPKFTLEVNNGLADYNLGAVSGITLHPLRNNYTSEPIALNEFAIGNSGAGPWIIEMGPRVQTKSEGFKNSYNFPGLSNVLAGPGLPARINVDLTSPQCPSAAVLGNARRFPLGKNINSINGKYTFFSPFAMCDGSTILYSYESKDWNEAELDKVKASYVKVSAVATTDIPCSLQLSCSLLDHEGNPLPIQGSNTVTVPANATTETGAFELMLTPADPAVPFEHIDGIRFTAKATQVTNGAPITPKQKITVNDIRFKLTGTYTTDF